MRQDALGDFPTGSGCGAAWLARLLGVQEVPSSNLGSPTKFLKDIRTTDPSQVAFWSPTGVQKGTLAYSPAAVGCGGPLVHFASAEFSGALYS